MSDRLSPGYRVRHPDAGEVSAVHATIEASEIAEFGVSEGFTVADLAADWQRLDLERDAWIVISPDGSIAGYGSAQDRGHMRIDVEIYVHPAHVGHGIGTTLVRLAETRARDHVLLAPSGERVVIHNWINALNTDARALLEREGYLPVRYFFRMELELNQEPARASWPEGIIVRSAEAGEDLRPFYLTAEEAMADHWGHVDLPFEEWRERHTGQQFDPGLWFLVLDSGEPVGVALCRNSDGVGWIDTLAVRKPWRGRGLGSALLRHAFHDLYRRGIRRVALGVDAKNATGATRLYEREGMRVTQRFVTYGKELRAGFGQVDVEGDG